MCSRQDCGESVLHCVVSHTLQRVCVQAAGLGADLKKTWCETCCRLGPRPAAGQARGSSPEREGAEDGTADAELLPKLRRKIRALHAGYGLALQPTEDPLSMLGGLQVMHWDSGFRV